MHACDALLDHWNDVMDLFGAASFAPEEQKQAAAEKFIGALDRMLEITCEGMEANKWKYAAGNKTSMADVCIGTYYANFAANDMSPFKQHAAAVFSKYPKLKPAIDAVMAECKSYLSTRPPRPV